VISGNDRGKRGKVLRVFPDRDRVLVEGINMRTKHQKPTQENPQGGRMKQEMPIHISNVLPVDPVSDQATRRTLLGIGKRKGSLGTCSQSER
jgi:large subunit ribosomal protein L24